MTLTLVPVTLAEAKRFVGAHHRHNAFAQSPTWKFGVGVQDDGVLVGVAIAGLPKARMMMDTYNDMLDGWEEDFPTAEREVRAWAWGTERECPECWGAGRYVEHDGWQATDVMVAPCPTCDGTGKVREAGLVERVYRAIGGEGPLESLTGGSQKEVLDALRAELGPDDNGGT